MTLRPTTRAPQLRWMVRLEHAKPTRLGEPARAGLVWTVTPYMARTADGRLLGGILPVECGSRDAALAHAHARQREVYGPRPALASKGAR